MNKYICSVLIVQHLYTESIYYKWYAAYSVYLFLMSVVSVLEPVDNVMRSQYLIGLNGISPVFQLV